MVADSLSLRRRRSPLSSNAALGQIPKRALSALPSGVEGTPDVGAATLTGGLGPRSDVEALGRDDTSQRAEFLR
jgi:hypothetical protein